MIIPRFLQWIREVFPLSDIQQLAARLGLELSYETIWGHTREVSPATAAAIIAALDYTPADTQSLVEFADAPLALLPARLDPAELDAPIHLRIDWENGTSTQSVWSPATPLPQAPAGYHTLTVQTSTRTLRFYWILAPRRCYEAPIPGSLNGINCFLPALRSQRNWGIGDFTDLTYFARSLATHAHFDFIALNPLHAIHNRAPYNTSPYLPLSIFTRNFVYLDIESLPEFATSALARSLAARPDFKAQLAALREREFVDYESVARIKTFFLALLYREYCRGDRATLDAYRTARGAWLTNYATYMAFDRYFHRRDGNVWHWRQWPAEYHSPTSPASQALAQRLARRIDFHAWVEMRLEQQLAAAHEQVTAAGYPLGLYQDLALATDRVGADYWAYQDLFAPGVRVGSPPDDFNENGQDWGFPALHPRRHADSGYRYFVESIRCAARHAGAIRLDHVMRLARLYWIPDNMSARDGAYVRDNFEDLLKILALESKRHRVVVVGEDLGTVPGYFRQALDEFGILSYRLILFERSGSHFNPAPHYPQQAIAAFTTHDLPTFDGWLSGADLTARVSTGQLPAHELEAAQKGRIEAISELKRALAIDTAAATADDFFAALCRFLAATPSRLRLVNLEELTADKEQQNMPGTTSEAPNWQRRLPVSLESLWAHPVVSRRLKAAKSALEQKRCEP